MEIQDLSYQNYYQRPILLPDRPYTHIPQESDVFRTAEGLIELSLSIENSGNGNIAPPLQPNQQLSLLGIKPNSNGALDIADLRTAFGEKSAELSMRLRQFFSSLGIHAPVATDLAVDSQGRVVVSNNSALEDEFAKNPELNTIFNELSSSAALLRAADADRDFAADYETNPNAAHSQFAHLFSENFKFTYHFEADKLSAAFKSESGSSIEWWQEA